MEIIRDPAKEILAEVYEFMQNNKLSNTFIQDLEILLARAKNMVDIPLIFNLPNEVMMIIFKFVGCYKPLVKFTCYRWKCLIKDTYSKGILLYYNSANILNWACKGIKVEKIKAIKWRDMMKNIFPNSPRPENSLIWLFDYNRYKHGWSFYCMIFHEAVQYGYLEFAKHLYVKNHFPNSIKINLKHIKLAIYNNDVEMFEWLHKTTGRQFRNEKIVKEFLNTDELFIQTN